MLQKTHEKIAEKIAIELGIKEKHDIALLVEGSVKPDTLKGFPHHKNKEDEIRYHIIRARAEFTENDDSWLEHLGIAFHYIQDMWTLHPRMDDNYTEWENQINDSPILAESKFIEHIKEAAIPTRAIMEYLSLLNEINNQKFANNTLEEVLRFSCRGRPDDAIFYGWSDHIIDLNFAYKICLILAFCVTDLYSLNKKRKFEKEREVLEKELFEINTNINDPFPEGKKITEEITKLEEKIGMLTSQNNALQQKKVVIDEKINSLQKEEDHIKGISKLFQKKSLEMIRSSKQKLQAELNPLLLSLKENQMSLEGAENGKMALVRDRSNMRNEYKIDEKLYVLNLKKSVIIDNIKEVDQLIKELITWNDYLELDEKSTKYRDQYIAEWGFPPP